MRQNVLDVTSIDHHDNVTINNNRNPFNLQIMQPTNESEEIIVSLQKSNRDALIKTPEVLDLIEDHDGIF